jgi:hypothetical protein
VFLAQENLGTGRLPRLHRLGTGLKNEICHVDEENPYSNLSTETLVCRVRTPNKFKRCDDPQLITRWSQSYYELVPILGMAWEFVASQMFP